jgi:5-hydroxyisourate hydrolase-like protein (transthyretin family)
MTRALSSPLLATLFLSASLYAAIDGTVINGTTGKPQPNATVTLYKVGGNGPESIQSVKSGPDGKFLITADAQGPRLVQAAFDGAVYNHMIPPGFPATDVKINVYQSSNKPGAAHVEQHMILLEPDGQNVTVSESYVFKNDGKITYSDPANGTLRLFIPPGAQGKAEVNVLSPNSVPVRRAPQKTSEANVYMLDFPVLPGESRVDVSYAMPFTSPGDFDIKTFYKGNATKIVAPQGVTMKAPGLQNLGQEPRTKATIYGIDGPAVTVQVAGTGALSRDQAAEGGDTSGGGGQGTLMQILPRIYGSSDPTGGFPAAVMSVKWILLPAFGILGLGFVLLYRKAADGR